jgi:hypothetical protein
VGGYSKAVLEDHKKVDGEEDIVAVAEEHMRYTVVEMEVVVELGHRQSRGLLASKLMRCRPTVAGLWASHRRMWRALGDRHRCFVDDDLFDGANHIDLEVESWSAEVWVWYLTQHEMLNLSVGMVGHLQWEVQHRMELVHS